MSPKSPQTHLLSVTSCILQRNYTCNYILVCCCPGAHFAGISADPVDGTFVINVRITIVIYTFHIIFPDESASFCCHSSC